jgi:hypothetical protein
MATKAAKRKPKPDGKGKKSGGRAGAKAEKAVAEKATKK